MINKPTEFPGLFPQYDSIVSHLWWAILNIALRMLYEINKDFNNAGSSVIYDAPEALFTVNVDVGSIITKLQFKVERWQNTREGTKVVSLYFVTRNVEMEQLRNLVVWYTL